MSNNEEFDRLARQKMNERQFAFDESQWLKAQSLMAGKRRNRGMFRFLWLLIPVCAVCIYLLAGRKNDHAVSPITSSFSSTQTSTNTSLTNDNKTSLIVSNETHSAPVVNDKIENSNESESISQIENVSATSTNPKGEETTVLTNKKDTKNKLNTENISPSTHSPNQAESKINSAKASTDKSVSPKPEVQNKNVVPVISNEPIATVDHSLADEQILDPFITPSSNLSANALYKSEEYPADHSIPYHESSKEEATSGNQEAEAKAAVNMNILPFIEACFYPAEEELMHTDVIAKKHMRLWKVSLLAGLWNNQTSISGVVHQTWMDNIQSNSTTGFAAEIIRSYHHFGWGSGIHYSTYSEDLDIAANYENRSENYRYWYLTPVDTTVWIITDSITGSNGVSYVGHSEDHTINVIRPAIGTRNTSVMSRDKRQIQNTFSYFEIPLLGDIHTGRGHWLVGLRGGPSIGKLTTRRGSLPNTEGSGYFDLGGTTMQQWVPGYSLRAYVDYKIGSNWSVGLQGGKRGLIGNTLNSDVYTRKTNAWGGMVSVSYLFRD